MEVGDTKGYICWSKNNNARANSTSGAVFYELAVECLSKNGVVYGAVFDDYFEVVHNRGTNTFDICHMQGSKYSQSKLGDTYCRVKFDLENGIKVLFTGTPCQVAGLKNYLGKEYDNLLSLDFICLGVPSPKVWKDYLVAFHEISKIERITFKDKRFGWSRWTFLVKSSDRVFRQPGSINYFMQAYLKHLVIRPSCYKCPFRTVHHTSDFTVADCWGIDKVAPELNDEKGISTLLVHTEKGEDYLLEIEERLNRIKKSVSDLLSENPYATNPIAINQARSNFFVMYKKSGIIKALKKYARRRNLLKLWKEEFRWKHISLNEFNEGSEL